MKPDEKIQSSVESQLVQGDDGSSTLPGSRSQLSLEAIPVINDRWEIVEFLGEGGMSVVYKARHKVMGKFSAIKLLHKHLAYQDKNLLRFQQESIAAGNIDHENVINVIDCGITEDEQPFLIMEYLSGHSLAQVISTYGKLDSERACVIFKQICAGMQAAHSKGIVHRDLKPSNVMLVDNKIRADFVKIVDFGIAKLLPQEESDNSNKHQLTQTGEVFGSPLYMSPEQCSGQKPDERSDIYSLGCLMYEALSGQPPLMGASYVETMFMQINDTPKQFTNRKDFDALTGRLEQVIFKCVAKDPADRYQSMAALEADLGVAKAGWLPWMLKGRALKDLPGIWRKANRRQIAFANALIACAVIFMVVAGASTYYGFSTYLSFQHMRNSIDKLVWWPERRQIKDDPVYLSAEKICLANELIQKRLFDKHSAEAESDYTVSIVKHAEILAQGGWFEKARNELIQALNGPMPKLRKSDPASAKEEQHEIDLQLSECEFFLNPKDNAKSCYDLVDAEIQKNGKDSPHYKFWLEISPRYADFLPESAVPAPDFLQALGRRYQLRKLRQQTHSSAAKLELKAAKTYLHDSAAPFIDGVAIYDMVEKIAQESPQKDQELAAKCLYGKAKLEERYGITDKTIKQYSLPPEESPQALYRKAMELLETLHSERSRDIYAKIGMDCANYLERSDPTTGFLKAWAQRKEVIEKFNNWKTPDHA